MSALIFVALAVAWAVYLIPKALEHHEAGERSRSISNFSHRLRVLGRRDAVSRSSTALVTDEVRTAAAPAQRAPAAPSAPSAPVRAPQPPPVTARRAAAVRATKRRRNVLLVILLLLVATIGAAVTGHAPTVAIAVPVAVLVAWLVACRLMVRKERSAPVRRPAAPAYSYPVEEEPAAEAETVPAVDDAPQHGGEAPGDVVDSAVGRWDPVDVPLPTYVSKPPAARRTVRTIDLDSTGVWSSGRNEADSALAREADASRQSEPTARTNRKTGS